MIQTFDPSVGDHILFLLLSVLLPFVAILSEALPDDQGLSAKGRRQQYWQLSLSLWAMALVILAYWWWKERPLSGLGLHWTPQTLSPGMIGFSIVFLLVVFIESFRDLLSDKGRIRLRRQLDGKLNFLPRNALTYLHFIPVALTAGICEEIIFRGYLISYLASLIGSHPIALGISVAVPAVVFGLVHWYQGKWAVCLIVGMAVAFGCIFVFSGSILLAIALHALVDLIAGSIGLFMPVKESCESAKEPESETAED